MKNNQSGFTLVELVVVMGIASTLFGLVIFSLINQQRHTSVSSSSDTLVSDMSSQQNKAMLGAGAINGNSYGIYFQSDKYILFTGNNYSSQNTTNFTVPIDPGYSIANITFPNNTLVFSARTGEVSGFSSGKTTVTIRDSDGTKIETITVNRYGVVTKEN